MRFTRPPNSYAFTEAIVHVERADDGRVLRRVQTGWRDVANNGRTINERTAPRKEVQ